MDRWRDELVERMGHAIGRVKTWDGETFSLNHTREELDQVAQAALSIAIPAILERAAAIATRHAEDADRVVSQSREGACRTSVMGESIAGRAIATAIRALKDNPDVEA